MEDGHRCFISLVRVVNFYWAWLITGVLFLNSKWNFRFRTSCYIYDSNTGCTTNRCSYAIVLITNGAYVGYWHQITCHHFFAGAVGILWFFAWIFLAYSSPATHPRISKKEREYIESSIMESVEQVCWTHNNHFHFTSNIVPEGHSSLFCLFDKWLQ